MESVGNSNAKSISILRWVVKLTLICAYVIMNLKVEKFYINFFDDSIGYFNYGLYISSYQQNFDILLKLPIIEFERKWSQTFKGGKKIVKHHYVVDILYSLRSNFLISNQFIEKISYRWSIFFFLVDKIENKNIIKTWLWRGSESFKIRNERQLRLHQLRFY